jgi:hypothetical protein
MKEKSLAQGRLFYISIVFFFFSFHALPFIPLTCEKEKSTSALQIKENVMISVLVNDSL